MVNNSYLHNNHQLAYIFHKMADCYRYMGNTERFRAIAYGNASRILSNMKEDISNYAKDVKTLDKIGGIGESIAEKIMEYLKEGKVETFEKLKKLVPYDLLELLDIVGFGPATLKILHEELKISNKEDLIRALDTGQLKGVKGFGEKKIYNMKQALKLLKPPDRILLQDAQKIGDDILFEIKKIPGIQQAEIAGSIRRKKDTIGDIDIVIAAKPRARNKIVSQIAKLPQVSKIVASGHTKLSLLLKYNDMQVDIRLVHDYEYGAAMLYFTGSKEHNIRLRKIARERGYKINEYGIFDIYTGKRMAGTTEREMYDFLQLAYVPPEQRIN